MEIEFAIFNIELILRKLESLINQINVLVLHFANSIKSVCLKITNPAHPDAQNWHKYIINIDILDYIDVILPHFFVKMTV